jgi:hypothetical protein
MVKYHHGWDYMFPLYEKGSTEEETKGMGQTRLVVEKLS